MDIPELRYKDMAVYLDADFSKWMSWTCLFTTETCSVCGDIIPASKHVSAEDVICRNRPELSRSLCLSAYSECWLHKDAGN